jgi:hypothetical protein
VKKNRYGMVVGNDVDILVDMHTILMEGICMEPLALTLIITVGAIVHHYAWMLFMMGGYLFVLEAIFSSENISLQYINSMK